MSLWVPKRDEHGRWHMYSINVPLQLVLFVLAFLTALVLVLVGGFMAGCAQKHEQPRQVAHKEAEVVYTSRITSRDGSRIESIIERWGGEVVEELDGSVDYVVLGPEPPEPGPADPDEVRPEVIARQIAAQEDYRHYHAVKRRAEELGIPVLSQGQFLRLVGYYDH